MTDRLNKLLSDSVHEGTPPDWYVLDELAWEQQENNALAEKHEREFAERMIREGEVCRGQEIADMRELQPSLWARLWNWFCGTETRSG